MTPLNCLLDPSLNISADASFLINLTSSQHASEILQALPNRVFVPDQVIQEINAGRRKGRQTAEALHQLLAEELLVPVQLGQLGWQHFEELTIGKAIDTLDDGEAAAIAYGLETACIPIIDERKGRRICAEKHPSLQVSCSQDVFSLPSIEIKLGRPALAAAMLKALEEGRMNVMEIYSSWIVDLIGQENLKHCSSLARQFRDG